MGRTIPSIVVSKTKADVAEKIGLLATGGAMLFKRIDSNFSCHATKVAELN